MPFNQQQKKDCENGEEQGVVKGTSVLGTDGGFDMVGQSTAHHG